MWLPTPLYETLPYSVVVIGSACIVGAINALMVASGVLLVLCGGVILKRRHDYRAANRLIEIQRARPPVRRRRSRRVVQLDLEADGL
ncbi:hypothetical protein [Allochromatium vinosum]|uniref:Uncharacterized protein n=1 Tax=Allochromatium vinosum (strain ATCC 17899 / DSM 180 / NBRC 103801 / NCIMB 10441 / D) TaxID=572477 RepID=D3RP88_ALLVD|nr:hypothetical protein [Allochromatium vinosum]ADC63478.1 hypothetical protein Alvin_2568 [Allochromatium vinosum DSM 180]MBK1656473.1 hypothetical protein [Allochromatium vinosum]